MTFNISGNILAGISIFLIDFGISRMNFRISWMDFSISHSGFRYLGWISVFLKVDFDI